jgi:C-terminal processing protease CtpA/Prc
MTLHGRVADPYAGFVDGGTLDPLLAGALLGESMEDAGVPKLAVGRVERDGAAWQTGLREGDRVLAVNRERVQRLEDLRRLLGRAGGLYALHIQRGDQVLALTRR